MDSNEIIARIKAQGHSQKSFAMSIGISFSLLRQVIYRSGKSRKSALLVAQGLNVPLHIMFPEYPCRASDLRKAASVAHATPLKRQYAAH